MWHQVMQSTVTILRITRSFLIQGDNIRGSKSLEEGKMFCGRQKNINLENKNKK
jgi:hypothetical protein